MNKMYQLFYPAFKSIAFNFDPELVHEFTMKSMHKIGPLIPSDLESFDFKVRAMGLELCSPIGLAAGLDKNAEGIDFLSSLPFGFIEIGTVTPKAQPGNDRPRLFRYPKEESLRNRMGFNNLGGDAVLLNLLNSNKRNKIIGTNLGKNKLTENVDAPNDYSLLYAQFAPYSDYLVINVSSPNTPGLRDLLQEKGLKEIFEATAREREKCARPLLVKVSPDMTFDQLQSVVNLVKEYGLTGIIATNTTIMPERGEGGMSGKILYQKSKVTREYLLNLLKGNPEIELIGVGGFSDFNEIKDYWIKGGKLIQIYSSFIFKGPNLLIEIEQKLQEEYKKYKVNNFDDYLNVIRK